jgi:hypothetical protein
METVPITTTLCDKVAGQWFSPGTLVSSTNKTDCHDIAEILLKVVLNTISIYIEPLYIAFKEKISFKLSKQNFNLTEYVYCRLTVTDINFE